MSNECLDVTLAELRAVGIEPTVEHGGKHIILRWTHGNAERHCVVSVTSSDRRAPLNSRGYIRRVLREDGYYDTEQPDIGSAVVRICSGEMRVSSLDISRHFGRPHKDVLQSIDRLIAQTGPEFTERNFSLSEYRDATGRALRCFDIGRDGFSMLVMGFTGDAAVLWKLRYIEAFNAMEAELRAVPQVMEGRLASLEGDVAALCSLFLEDQSPPRIVRSAGFIRLRPEYQRAMLARAATA